MTMEDVIARQLANDENDPNICERHRNVAKGIVEALRAAGYGRTRIDTVEELRELPMLAVVYDHDNEVWQKRAYGWYMPGSDMAAASEAISLPAYLLDDGL